MSEVVEFRSPPPPYEPPRTKLGHDESWLKMCAEWRALRHEQQKRWALHERDTMWGMLPDAGLPAVDTAPLERMQGD
jgi:hypothetical protein